MNWQDRFRDAFKSSDELAQFLDVSLSPTPYPVYLPKSFAHKIKKAGPESALWKQFVPHSDENKLDGLVDPIGDSVRARTRGIVHRYQNRLLFFPTSMCPIQCRYCFRKNELHHNDPLFIPQQEELRSYLAGHPEVNEVIFSGGDPLVLSDDVLCRWLDIISEYSHIKFIRFHTRMPIILPERLNADFFSKMAKYQQRFHKMIIVLHCNHAEELDAEVELWAQEWRAHSFEFLTQSVLLKGVNDNLLDLKALIEKIIHLGWRPYYLHHPDQAKGAMHFTLDQQEGLDIFNLLRASISGWGLPQYIVDRPSAEGKTLVN